MDVVQQRRESGKDSDPRVPPPSNQMSTTVKRQTLADAHDLVGSLIIGTHERISALENRLGGVLSNEATSASGGGTPTPAGYVGRALQMAEELRLAQRRLESLIDRLEL